jgi:hypothetical protein
MSRARRSDQLEPGPRDLVLTIRPRGHREPAAAGAPGAGRRAVWYFVKWAIRSCRRRRRNVAPRNGRSITRAAIVRRWPRAAPDRQHPGRAVDPDDGAAVADRRHGLAAATPVPVPTSSTRRPRAGRRPGSGRAQARAAEERGCARTSQPRRRRSASRTRAPAYRVRTRTGAPAPVPLAQAWGSSDEWTRWRDGARARRDRCRQPVAPVPHASLGGGPPRFLLADRGRCSCSRPACGTRSGGLVRGDDAGRWSSGSEAS